MDLVTDVDDACATSGGGTLWLWQLPRLGSFQFNDGQAARVVAVDAETATVIVMAEALPEGQAEYDHFLEHFGELLNAMTIGPLDLSYWARSARRRSTNRSMRSIASSICS